MRGRRSVLGSLSVVLAVSLLAGAAGCKKKKKPTERERYAEHQKTWKFRAYKQTTRKLGPPLLAAANKAAPAGDEMPLHLFRLILGHGWVVEDKGLFAIAEGQLILEQKDTPAYGRALGHILISMGLRTLKLKTLADEEGAKGKKLLESAQGAPVAKAVQMVGHVLLAVHAIRHRKLEYARLVLKGFRRLSGIGWPVSVVTVLLNLDNKELGEATKNAGKLSGDEAVPAPVRIPMASLAAGVSDKVAKTVRKLDWASTLAAQLYDHLKRSLLLRHLFDATDKIRSLSLEPDFSSITDRAKKLLDRIKD